jgi:hypothetical protein
VKGQEGVEGVGGVESVEGKNEGKNYVQERASA